MESQNRADSRSPSPMLEQFKLPEWSPRNEVELEPNPCQLTAPPRYSSLAPETFDSMQEPRLRPVRPQNTVQIDDVNRTVAPRPRPGRSQLIVTPEEGTGTIGPMLRPGRAQLTAPLDDISSTTAPLFKSPTGEQRNSTQRHKVIPLSRDQYSQVMKTLRAMITPFKESSEVTIYAHLDSVHDLFNFLQVQADSDKRALLQWTFATECQTYLKAILAESNDLSTVEQALKKRYGLFADPTEAKRAAYNMRCGPNESPHEWSYRLRRTFFDGGGGPRGQRA
ncbi:uncharacterized protein LOC115476947 [Microcaecilia unicolor]|uniref:Uncharacterized protein LOC115476309 n=1 Tax=Microcaecilia unicolor TaxID=1415580 RepID=A0A6P7YWR1_9AMPH|nr:uncharacterized protein LOC115476309 [Microcaecilia unicolor]XP_030069398.1 uncharacterized protein LOC115476947 [Microcaecilia unicolor]